MALTAHHLEQSQSFRIVWLLEELKIPYELKLYQRSSTGYAPKDYKVLSPLGTAPCITDEVGDKKIVLCETNAIIDYILDKAEDNIETRAKAHQLRPSRAVGAAKSSQLQLRSNYLFWFHASTASFQSVMSIDSLVRILKQRTPWPLSTLLGFMFGKLQINYIDQKIHAIFQTAEKALKVDSYLAGTSYLTAADIAAVYSFDSAFTRYPELAHEYPACSAYFQERILARLQVQRALAKVGEKSIAYEA